MKFTKINILIILLIFTLLHFLICPVAIEFVINGTIFHGIHKSIDRNISNFEKYIIIAFTWCIDIIVLTL